MARILVQTTQPESEEIIQRHLKQSEHQVFMPPTVDPTSIDDKQLGDNLVQDGPDLVIMDYIPRDALSLKAFQRARLQSPALQMILLLGNGAPPADELAMLFNEGVTAVLHQPVNEHALDNYINRALKNQHQELERIEELSRRQAKLEKEEMRQAKQAGQLARYKNMLKMSFRLIDRLLLAGSRSDFTQAKILLFSDSQFQTERLKRQLEKYGFTVLTAPDATSGLETAHQEKPRIIISDLELPDLQGTELCRMVKNDETLSPNYFIICTANETKVPEVLKPENLVDDCLLKPGDEEELEEFTARVAMGLLV